LINLKKWVLLIPFNIIQIYRTRRFLNHVEYVVFVSKWMKETAELHSLKRYANAKIIPNPVDTDSFKFAPIEKRDRKRGISLRGFSNTKYGLDIAIKAFSKQDQVKLDIVGKGIYRDKFISMSKRLDANVEIIEKVIPHSKIAEYYRPYGFFVAPSRIEAQGVAMCEAMACGLPVISTNVGGIPEFIRDGEDGYLVPKNDSEQLMQAVNKLMALSNEEYDKMSNNARENVLNTCSSSVITRMELDVLTKAVTKYKQKLV
jgi:glycosyltransferase involved in cell wall biosynthesis